MKTEGTKKKRSLVSLMSILLLFVLVTTCLMSGTLAKYVGTATGGDTARVAKWGFDGINAVSIFKTSYNGTVESASTDKVVAPGTGGSFSFSFKSGISEVSTKIAFNVTETNVGGIPTVYKYNNLYYSDQLTGAVHVKLHGSNTYVPVTITGNIAAMGTAIGSNAAYSTVAPKVNYDTLAGGTIEWYWAFEQADDTSGANLGDRDEDDTALGKDGTATVTLNVVLAAEQID